jgi:membrane-bound serine protease (ClpP class)
MDSERLRWPPRLLAALTVGIGLFLCAPFFLQAEEREATVVVTTVDGEITAGTVALVSRSLAIAEERSATLIIELHTPGGLLRATEEISRLLIDSRVPTVVFVHKEGGQAFSAGTFILFSADRAAATPTASIGAALPVGLGGGAADEKTINATAAWLQSLALRTGKDGAAARAFVTESLTLSGSAAAAAGFVDILAPDLPTLLSELELTDANMVRLQPTVFDNVLSLLSLPYLVPLFLSLGALGIFLMLRTGEVELVGLLGIIFLLLGLWGMGAIELSLLGALLLLLGLVLLAIEALFSPGFGVAGAVGIISALSGIIMFANEPLFPGYLTQTLFYVVLGIGIGVAAIMALLGRLSLSAAGVPIQVGPEALLGREVAVSEPLSPIGAVVVDGERYQARRADGAGTIAAGDRVRVVRVEGNTILVAPLTNR